jgi:hypothetical protein
MMTTTWHLCMPYSLLCLLFSTASWSPIATASHHCNRVILWLMSVKLFRWKLLRSILLVKQDARFERAASKVIESQLCVIDQSSITLRHLYYHAIIMTLSLSLYLKSDCVVLIFLLVCDILVLFLCDLSCFVLLFICAVYILFAILYYIDEFLWQC